MSTEPKFYVYAHIRNDDGRIFYVGKGYGRRAFVTQRRSKHWTSIFNKVGRRVEFFGQGLTEKEAMDLEIQKIAEIGLENLCNLTIGGDGASGFKMNEEQRQRVIKNLTGRIFSAETRKKISDAHKGRKRDRSVVEAHAEKIRGRKQSAETIEKRRRYLLGRKMSPETKAKIAASNTGKTVSVKTKLKLSESHVGKIRSEESKRKQSQTMLERAAKSKDVVYGRFMKQISCSNGMLFKSLSEAAGWVSKDQGKEKSKSAISRCALGKRKTAHGFTWSYIED